MAANLGRGLISIFIICTIITNKVTTNNIDLEEWKNNLALQLKSLGLPTIQPLVPKNISPEKKDSSSSEEEKDAKTLLEELFSKEDKDSDENEVIPCRCGVFFSSQFKRGHQPKGHPALVQELEKEFPCNKHGIKKCQLECFQTMIKYLPNSAEILCATSGLDIHKERAHLFIQNCNKTWHNSNLSAGREYCCKLGVPYQCPLI